MKMRSHRSSTPIQSFQYPLSGLPVQSNWLDTACIETEAAAPAATDTHGMESVGEVSAKELERAFESGRREGAEEARSAQRVEQARMAEEFEMQKIEMAARLNEQFALERDRYLRAIEPEVVTLALRVAERILRREVRVDPLMLTGAVRVALSQLADTTGVRMRVPAKDAELWKETLGHLPNLRVRPVIVADDKLGEGECHIESNVGSVDLSIQTQLQEITRSLLGQTTVETNQGVHADSTKVAV